MGVARSLADHVHRGTLPLGNLTHVVYVFLVDEQSHAFLTLVGDNLFGAEGLVADRQFCHVYPSAALLDKLAEAVEVAGRTVVVDADHRVDVAFAQCSDEVVGAFLHLRVGTLHGVKLYSV